MADLADEIERAGEGGAFAHLTLCPTPKSENGAWMASVRSPGGSGWEPHYGDSVEAAIRSALGVPRALLGEPASSDDPTFGGLL